MKSARLLAVAIATLASLPLMAQQSGANAQVNTSGSVSGSQVNGSAQTETGASASRGQVIANSSTAGSISAHGRGSRANMSGSAAGTARMRPVTGELQRRLDSKTAKVGEPVVLKTTEKTRTADGTVLPRGSRLIGHVTFVQAHEEGHEESSLGVVFDRAELKNGQSFEIRSVIESVRPSQAALDANEMDNDDAGAGISGMGGGARAMGGGMVGGHGGGLVGGGGAGLVGNTTAAAGRIGSGVGTAAGGAVDGADRNLDATGNLAGDATGSLGHNVAGSVGTVGSLGVHATAFPGVMLNSSATEAASGTFTAARKNIDFDSGTQMVVAIAAAR